MKLVAYDLGTGGVKASLFDEQMHTLARSFLPWQTRYPGPGMHEQRPEDWWSGVVRSTKTLLSEFSGSPEEIGALALSGHSLVTVPIDTDGHLLADSVPIWSDTRPGREAEQFFRRIPEEEWYLTTGNGFPAPCYSIFKLMWLKNRKPDLFARIHKVLGSKDYINFRLTGVCCTDHSYASGTGAYDLTSRRMRQDFLDAAGIPAGIFPEIVPSHTVVGRILPGAAREIGLSEHTLVACGGVDNACMALGAVGAENGKIYTSLGSSSWVPVNSRKPVLDFQKKPYVFAHIEEGMYTSAFSIFAGGSSFSWAKDVLCKDITDRVYDRMSEMAASVPVGSGGIFFNPSLAGGTSQDKSVHIRGAYIGLHLGTTREAMVRAAMEGICMNLKESVLYLREQTGISGDILFCGGGSRSRFWMQMFADVFNTRIIKTNIDQDAAAVGAAAIAARTAGIWQDYKKIPSLHRIEQISSPDPVRAAQYEKLQRTFVHISSILADLGEDMSRDRDLPLP